MRLWVSWECWEETVNPGVRQKDKLLSPTPGKLRAKGTSIRCREDNTRARAASGEAPHSGPRTAGKREHRGFVCRMIRSGQKGLSGGKPAGRTVIVIVWSPDVRGLGSPGSKRGRVNINVQRGVPVAAPAPTGPQPVSSESPGQGVTCAQGHRAPVLPLSFCHSSRPLPLLFPGCQCVLRAPHGRTPTPRALGPVQLTLLYLITWVPAPLTGF